jgi:hypothetical protein
MAWTYNGAAGDHFGSMANLAAVVESLTLEKLR